jgi:hypothetical protein
MRSPSIPLVKGEEENLIDSPPFTRGAGGIYTSNFKNKIKKLKRT